MLEGRSRGYSLGERVKDRRGGTLGEESGNRRRRTDIGAGRSSASQNAAKPVMPDGNPARNAATCSLDATIDANFARKREGGGWRGGNEEGLQQQRVNRERADRDAPCNQTLAETPHS